MKVNDPNFMETMDFSIPNNLDSRISLRELFLAAAAKGFSKIALTDILPHCDYYDHTSRLQLLAHSGEAGVAFDTLHVPVGTKYDISSKNADLRMEGVCNVANAMHAARVLGARTVVISVTHALPNPHGSDTRSVIHALNGLIETAEIMRINLAMRNLIDSKSLETIAAALSEYDSPYFGLCYDAGLDMLADHEPYVLIDDHGHRLKAVIFADSDGKSRYDLMPFTGLIDWHRILAMIADHGYEDPILLGRGMRDVTIDQLSEAAAKFNEMQVH